MKARDIHLGDLVYYTDPHKKEEGSRIMKVELISDYLVHLRKPSSGGIQLLSSECRDVFDSLFAIPLTEEIIRILGFVPVDFPEDIAFCKSKLPRCYSYQKSSLYLCFGDSRGHGFYIGERGGVQDILLGSVHTLQQAYYMISGKTLDLSPNSL